MAEHATETKEDVQTKQLGPKEAETSFTNLSSAAARE